MQVINPNSSGPWSQQYSDERWKNRAKSFREKIGNFCQSCRREGVVLNVHHVNYKRGVKLWDHSDEDLALLCENCHQSIHQTIRVFRVISARCNAANIAAITGLIQKSIQRHGDTQTAIKIAKAL